MQLTIVLTIVSVLSGALAATSVPRVQYLMPDIERELVNSSSLPVERIINGNTAVKNAFPYQCGLEIYQSAGYTWCGCSIISQWFILTAAHCVDSAISVTVILGAHDRRVVESTQKRVTVGASNIIVHENWGSLRNDIALVRMPEKIVYTTSIMPISLPLRAHRQVNFELNPAVATGWGYTAGTSSLARYLQYADVTIQRQQECLGWLSPWVRDTNICVDGSQGKGACFGDSGSPLATTGTVRYVIGIASFIGYDGCEAGWPTVYTRVTSYLEWINSKTGITIY